MQLETIISTLLSASALLKKPVQDAASQSIKDLFDAARYYLRRKFGEGSEATKILDLATEKPGSVIRKAALVEESASAGLGSDPELTRLVEQLRALLPTSAGVVQQNVRVIGRSNRVQVATGDIITTERHIQRAIITPDERHLSTEQREKIRAVVADLAARLAGENGAPNFAAAHRMLQRRFNVASYAVLPREKFGEALGFLKQQRAVHRSRLRRRNPVAYQNDFFRSIYAGAGEMGWDRPRVCGYAEDKLGLKKPLLSLKELGPKQLKSLSDFVHREVAKARAASGLVSNVVDGASKVS